MLHLTLLRIFGSLFVCGCVCGPPISPQSEVDVKLETLLQKVDYRNYLSQVIMELQGDVNFSNNMNDVKDPDDIANLLKHASGRVRTKLDELKRIEIARLNKIQAEWNRQNSYESHPLEMPLPPRALPDISHLDDLTPESFNSEDLKKLLQRTSNILNKIDAKDEETYRYHEMEKKAAKRVDLEKILDNEERQKEEKKWSQEEMQRRRQHKPIHNPGSKEHLQSVWKKDDHMDDYSFDPKSFFYMHDMNNDGYLDVAELETLMQRELDKAYDLKNNDTDLVERDHEMTRMRNEILSNVDKDNNHLISLDEFNKWVHGEKFNTDKEWKVQEEFEPNYSDEEFEQFYKDYTEKHSELHKPTIQQSTAASP